MLARALKLPVTALPAAAVAAGSSRAAWRRLLGSTPAADVGGAASAESGAMGESSSAEAREAAELATEGWESFHERLASVLSRVLAEADDASLQSSVEALLSSSSKLTEQRAAALAEVEAFQRPLETKMTEREQRAVMEKELFALLDAASDRAGLDKAVVRAAVLTPQSLELRYSSPEGDSDDGTVDEAAAEARRLSELERRGRTAEARLPEIRERVYGTGRRKASSARVWVQPGSGKFTVNGRPVASYFGRTDWTARALAPLYVTSTIESVDVIATCQGGGLTGHADALSLGIARALKSADEEYRYELRRHGLLTRDSRVVERKKPGLKKARRARQWVKR
eukprot:PLAT14803.1.p1 GENE.PLAT14803.1~~PLAT14803.1.p1  ORF type:complete len:348 (-),score=138.27 PLAT14803.1:132-1154(-)